MAIETTTGARLLQAHVERFNAGAASGDYTAMVDALAEDAQLTFVGIPVGPFDGREAIRTAYIEQPPDEGIDIVDVDEPDARDRGRSRYRWQRSGGTGTMTITHHDGVVDGVTVAFDAPAATDGLDPPRSAPTSRSSGK